MQYKYFYDHAKQIFGREDQDGNMETRNNVEIHSHQDFLNAIRAWETEN